MEIISAYTNNAYTKMIVLFGDIYYLVIHSCSSIESRVYSTFKFNISLFDYACEKDGYEKCNISKDMKKFYFSHLIKQKLKK